MLEDEAGESIAYMPFYRSLNTDGELNDNGYMMYIDQREISSDSLEIKVVVVNQNQTLCVKSQEIVFSDFEGKVE